MAAAAAAVAVGLAVIAVSEGITCDGNDMTYCWC